MIRTVTKVATVLRLIARRLLQGLGTLFGVSWIILMGSPLIDTNHSNDEAAVIIFAVGMIVLLLLTWFVWWVASLIK